MWTELLMSLYKQWGVTHYTFDVIVLTSSEKSFSRLHRRIFLKLIISRFNSNLNLELVDFDSKHNLYIPLNLIFNSF